MEEKATQYQRELTLGEKRVGWTFNPSNNTEVDFYKTSYANLIDTLETSRDGGGQEKQRLISMAQTDAEKACMLAVKSIFQ